MDDDAQHPTGPRADDASEVATADASVVFPHLDARGHARMVDVTAKATTSRTALARGRVAMSSASAQRLGATSGSEGEFVAARTAAVFAAKATSDLLPLCHPIRIGDVTVDFALRDDGIEITTTVEAADRTGVEMEALTACAVAALTLYGHVAESDSSASIEDVAVWEKSGGRSGTWQRQIDGSVHHLLER